MNALEAISLLNNLKSEKGALEDALSALRDKGTHGSSENVLLKMIKDRSEHQSALEKTLRGIELPLIY
ncbi:hypothetical protein ABD91_20285 [Lysinibacillus sphaericus]|uniref:hypothetical protein n=1 Tax=Lysinibacillus sphaericus TaxID=1421 RepID=UPI0018CD6BB7|nr:hypothetical protein [Lysinibacillus sphaericus]MBG9693089.1 hypothetical protein [Lysinibacillus sphaericus]